MKPGTYRTVIGLDVTSVLRQIGCNREYTDIENFVIMEREIRDIKMQIAGLYGRKKMLEEEKEKLWRAIVVKSRHGEFPFLKGFSEEADK